MGLDYIYKAFNTTDLAAAIGGVRALGVRGCAVSMPFKKTITGAEVFAIQVVEQFVLYTGIRPSDTLFNQAGQFARG